MSINWQDIIFNFLGGLGLFLYSIKMMGDGLQQAAGDRLRYFIDKYTSNPILGILVGIGMTALIQSSWDGKCGAPDLAPGHRDCHGSQYRNNSDFLHHWF